MNTSYQVFGFKGESGVASMPRGSGEEGKIVFFSPRRFIDFDDMENEFGSRGLKPADPFLLAKANQDNSTFAASRPNCTLWKNENGKWCYITFDWYSGAHRVSVGCDHFDWSHYWWFAGVPK